MATVMPWRRMLADSLEANKHIKQSKYFQLATVRENGTPAVRTVVFRGFDEGNMLLITTDGRSRKVEEIKAWPMGELVVYFGETWEQFRFSGPLEIIGPQSSPERQTIRSRLWNESSPKSLLQFVSPAPGLPVSVGGEEQRHVDKAGGPLDNFLVLALEPTKIDYLNLAKRRESVSRK